jgi:hypothetical protein
MQETCQRQDDRNHRPDGGSTVHVSDFRALPPGGTMLENDIELHVALADDRDAAAEAARLAALVEADRPLRVAELFAGGGYHGRALAEAGHDVHYVDYSAGMKQYMVEQFGLPPQRYHLAELPDWPDSARAAAPFDLIVMARFAAGYLTPEQLGALADTLAGLLEPGAVWAVELQDQRSVRDGHRDLAIRVREAAVNGRRAVLEFPDAEVLIELAEGDRPPVLWQSLTLTVTERGDTEATRYSHWEYLYDRARLLSIPAVARNFEALSDDVSAVFPQSDVVALRRR